MGNMSLLRLVPSTEDNDQLESLRVEAARVHPQIHRLVAEAEIEYGDRKNALSYVVGRLNQFDAFVEGVTIFLDWLSDQQSDSGMVGNFSLPEARRRLDFFQRKVRQLEAAAARKTHKELPASA